MNHKQFKQGIKEHKAVAEQKKSLKRVPRISPGVVRAIFRLLPITTTILIVLAVTLTHPVEYVAKRTIAKGEIVDQTNTVSRKTPIIRLRQEGVITKRDLGNVTAIERFSSGQVIMKEGVEEYISEVALEQAYHSTNNPLKVGELVSVVYLNADYESEEIKRTVIADLKLVIRVEEGNDDSGEKPKYIVELTKKEHDLYRELNQSSLQGITIVTRQII